MSSIAETTLVPEISLSSSIVEELSQNPPMVETKNEKAGCSSNKVHEISLVSEGTGREFLNHGQVTLLSEATTIASKENAESGAELSNTESIAAVTVQKLYRSYRTRRNIADCAVMAKKFGWWSVLEGALLRQTSETFYAFEKRDTAAARWSRLRKKASRVGKGLLKDKKARKLAIQHWLEAIDARHRYGHNLHFYYDVWQQSQTHEPFFYWLDVGEGRDLELPECSRSKLLKEQIKYLSPKERENYEVVVEDGKLMYKKSGELVNTPKGDKYIFVMSTSGKLYIAKKEKGRFQHSSFLAGAATTAAGRLLVTDGILQLIEAHSGHYHPTEDNFKELVNILTKLGADLTMAKVQCVSDDMLTCHGDTLVKSDSHKEVLESVEAVTEQSHMITYDMQRIEDVGEGMGQSYTVNKVNSNHQGCGTADDCLGSSFNKDVSNDRQLCLELEGLRIEMLGQCGGSNMLINLVKERTTASEKALPTTVTELREETMLPSQVLKEGVQAAGVQEVQNKNVRLQRWSSGTGPRISSLSEIPRDILEKAWQGIDRPHLAVATSEG